MQHRYAQSCLALLFATLPVACALDGTSVDPAQGEAALEAAGTLEIEGPSSASGLRGTFSKGGDSISFEAVRRVVSDPEGEAAEDEVDVRFLDQDGRTFKVRVAGQGLMDPAWQRDLEAEYDAEEAGQVDHDKRARAFALLREAGEALSARSIAGMEVEHAGVVAAAKADRGLDEESSDSDLEPVAAPALDPEELAEAPDRSFALADEPRRTMGSTSNVFAGDHDSEVTQRAHRTTCSGGGKYVHSAEVRYDNDEIVGIFNYEHSATLLRSTCDACGTVVLEIEHCNHGRCALDPAMGTKCHGVWGKRGAALLGTGGCTTEYVAVEGFSGHVCNDDSLLQYTEVRTNTPYNANGGTCSNRDLRKWAPSCEDGYPYALRVSKRMSSTAWSGWTHVEGASVGTNHFLVRHQPRRSGSSDTIEVLRLANGVPYQSTFVDEDTDPSVSWKVVKPVQTSHGTYLIGFQYGRLSIRRLLADGSLSAPTYRGSMPGPSGSGQWSWDMIDSYTRGGKTFVVFHDRVRVSSAFANGIGALAIYELEAGGTLTATSFSLQDPNLRIHVLTTSAGAFLMQNSTDTLETVRLTDNGMIGTKVAAFKYGNIGKAWDEMETFDNDEGTFVVLYKAGGQSCDYGGTTPCMQTGQLATYRVYRDGKIGYQFGDFDWPTVHGELELETIKVGSEPYLFAFQPERGMFETYRLNRR